MRILTLFSVAFLSIQTTAVSMASEGEATSCNLTFGSEFEELTQVGLLASLKTAHALEAGEISNYMDAFKKRELVDKLKRFPKNDLQIVRIRDAMKMVEECDSSRFTKIFSPGIKTAAQEAEIIEELRKPHNFLVEDENIYLAGTSVLNEICFQKAVGNLDPSLIKQILQQPSLSNSILIYLLRQIKPSKDSAELYLAMLKQPELDAHDVSELIEDAKKASVDAPTVDQIALAVVKSRNFAEEPSALSVNLLNLGRGNPTSSWKIANLLTSQNPIPLSALVISGSALAQPIAGQDYSELYKKLATGLSVPERVDLLNSFLWGSESLDSSESEVESFAKNPLVNSQIFLPLALQELNASKRIDKNLAKEILQRALADTQSLTAEEALQIERSMASPSLLSNSEHSTILERVSKEMPYTAEILVVAGGILGDDPSQDKVLLPFARDLIRDHLNDQTTRSYYEELMERVSPSELRSNFSLDWIQSDRASEDFVDQVVREATANRKAPNFPLVLAAVEMPGLKKEEILKIAQMLSSRFAGRRETPGLEPVLQAILHHPLANEETKALIDEIFQVKWSTLPSDAPLPNP
jgi:hypothetical protein